MTEFNAALTAIQDNVTCHESLGHMYEYIVDVRRAVGPHFAWANPPQEGVLVGASMIDMYGHHGFRESFLLSTLPCGLSTLLAAARFHLGQADAWKAMVRVIRAEKSGPIQLALIESKVGMYPFGERPEEAAERRAVASFRRMIRQMAKGANGIAAVSSLAGQLEGVSLIPGTGFAMFHDDGGQFTMREYHSPPSRIAS